MAFRHLMAVARKELAHILRDGWTLSLVLFTPLLVLILMAYALSADIQHVPIAVLDRDRSPASRTFVAQITAGDDLELYATVEDLGAVEDLFTRGEIKGALIIAPTFAADVASLKGMPIQIIIDGTEPETGGFAVEQIGRRAAEFANAAIVNQLAGAAGESLQTIDLRVRAWYNPSLEPRVDLIPGLISLVLAFPALSAALTLAREREHGTLEQLLATPIGRGDLLLGKIVPYIIVGLINVILITAVARVWFRVPFNGNFALYFGLSALFMFAALSMGVLVGMFMRTQAAALALSFLLLFFPAFFLTGIFFPIVAMPEIARLEAMGLPGTHYAIITRGVFLPGVGIEVLWPYAVMLIFLGVVFTALAALFFRKKIG
ncbi:MAG: ABC transporter permease [Anaerolineae bacterium]|nr:MAG: ABC transporter permease [Anaerolineae bacterium]